MSKMEKVWEELKKIEAKAEQIRSEAQSNAEKITALAHGEAEELVGNSKIYAEEEAGQLYEGAVKEANCSREEQLKANQKATEKLRGQAGKRMEQASDAVVDAVLGETKR
jgi:vacuolar-type H+-ATPase subunit H